MLPPPQFPKNTFLIDDESREPWGKMCGQALSVAFYVSPSFHLKNIDARLSESHTQDDIYHHETHLLKSSADRCLQLSGQLACKISLGKIRICVQCKQPLFIHANS